MDGLGIFVCCYGGTKCSIRLMEISSVVLDSGCETGVWPIDDKNQAANTQTLSAMD